MALELMNVLRCFLSQNMNGLLEIVGAVAPLTRRDLYCGLCAQVTRESLRDLLGGREPLITALHAGLECGLIGEKFPGMDMVRCGGDRLQNTLPAAQFPVLVRCHYGFPHFAPERLP